LGKGNYVMLKERHSFGGVLLCRCLFQGYASN
jgi:hypothetical protein